MTEINSLRDIIQFNSNFKTAINLYLSLNKAEKVLGYIPTKSSVSFLGEYLKAVLENKEQATLLVGPYGKGKSHLLLVLLAVLSMERTPESESVINELIDKVSKTDEVGERVSEYIGQVWDKKRFLPVLITDTTGDLNQAFLYGLNDALKRDRLLDLAPETYYSIALDRIDDWEQNYFETYKMFERELTQNGMNIAELKTNLKQYSQKALILFKEIYPKVTAGSEFNPMALSDALSLYKSVSEKLVDEYGYSGIYIVFDEFSKFIEGQNNTAAGTNMHLLQSMCELATDSKNAQVFITMVTHKSIKEYGKYLSRDLINLFTGIEGRIIEKYFVTSSKNNYELIKNAIVKDDSKLLNIPHYEKYLGKEKFKEFFSLPAFRSGFYETEFKNVIFNGCYPLNPIAAYLLLNISEKVAQNERTLFTFISNDEPHSMARFVSEHTSDKEWSIGADLIYEYFSALFKKDVVNEFIHNIWLSAEYAIDKCDTEDQRKIVKALAVILIVNKEDEIPATEKYLKLCINASDPEQALIELKKKEFIYKKNSTGSYVFKTRAGSELKAEIKRQRELKGDNVNYSKVLLDVTGNYFIIPRKYNTVKMMTRYFTNEFMDVDDFLNITSSTVLLDNTLDGKVITLYSFSRIKQEAVKQHLLELAEKRLVVICPKKGLKAKKQLKDYEIISDLKENQLFTDNNEILKRELPLLLDDLTIELETIIGSVYEDDLDTKVFYFNDDRIENVKSGNVEEAVNECCLNVYTSTPIINNEMVNRAEIGTAQTKKARLNIVHTILSHTDTPEFYNGSNQEATIYRALFGVTGIIDGDTREDIQFVIDEINRYVDSCCDKKAAVKEMVYKLVKAPYGMRTGVIPFYLAYVLANRREDIIVYFLNKEVQITSEIVVNMCEQPEDYAIYALDDYIADYKRKCKTAWQNAWNNYRALISQDSNDISNEITIEIGDSVDISSIEDDSPQFEDEKNRREDIIAQESYKRAIKDTICRMNDEGKGEKKEEDLTQEDIVETMKGNASVDALNKIFKVPTIIDNKLWEPYVDAEKKECVRISKNHRYAKLIYENNSANKDLQILFELLLYIEAKAELQVRKEYHGAELEIVSQIMEEYRVAVSEKLAKVCRKEEGKLPPNTEV